MKRRNFLKGALLATAGVRSGNTQINNQSLFGPLIADPETILDLPKEFTYQIIARVGDEMDDGLLVPGRADGMHAFKGSEGKIIIICNHENHPTSFSHGPFGKENEKLGLIDQNLVYDFGKGKTPSTGGTTSIVYNPMTKKTERQYLSLAGTEINCAGGPTPWGSWLSCEETFKNPGTAFEGNLVVEREKRHGYVFEVPITSKKSVKPVPLKAMGRFEHEAASVDPVSGFIYLTEDKHRSLFYRFTPNVPKKLSRGGQLQALSIVEKPSFDTRNWFSRQMEEGKWMSTNWINLNDVDSNSNDLRLRGYDQGAAIFARGEGICYADDSFFFTATIGGTERMGQIFEYRPNRTNNKNEAGHIRLITESTTNSLLRHADNLVMSPWGDLIICEDTFEHCGLVGIKPNGEQYTLADNPYTDSELAGICFSPDGLIMFVNIQERGLTLAISGPWPS